MSYSIDEAIEDTRRRLKTLQRIAEEYPDATLQQLPDGTDVWSSDGAADKCTDVHIVTTKGSGQAFFCVFAKVGEHGRVYGGYDARGEHSFVVLDRLDPKTRTALIKAVRGGR